MDFGITIPRDGLSESPEPLKQLTHFAQAAESMGWSYLVLGDRIMSGLDSLCIFASVAGATSRIRLATSVLVLPPRGVLLTAKQLTTIDVLSGGRLTAGVGTGSMYGDYEAVGMEPDEMWPRLEEGVQAIRAYLTPGAPPFQGRFYRTAGASLPSATQTPCLPIWIGSWGSERGLRRVARLADGWLSSAGPGHQTPEQYKIDRALLDRFLTEEGKIPSTFPAVAATMALFVSESTDERDRVVGPGYERRPTSVGLNQPPRRESDDPHAHDMVGNRAECIEKVRRWREAGINGLFLTPRGPDPLGQARIFIDEVVSRA